MFLLAKIFQILHNEFAKCSTVLICALALLTDELVYLDTPTFDVSEIPRKELEIFLKENVSLDEKISHPESIGGNTLEFPPVINVN